MLTDRWRKLLDLLLLVVVGGWMYWVIGIVPPAQVEAGGWAQKIFYVHVPSAMISFFGFLVVAVISCLMLFADDEFWDPKLRAVLEVSYVYTTIVLLTGPFWAKPVWGIWWRWEPRMTTFFVLWLMYGGWFLFRRSLHDRNQKRIYSAIYAFLAFLNVPVVMASVYFWKPQHQLHPESIELEPIMQATFYASNGVLLLLFLRLVWMRLEIESLISALEDREWKT